MSGRPIAGTAPGRRIAAEEPRRLATLARPIAAALRARALAAAPIREHRPRAADGRLVAGAPGAAADLWTDARTIARSFGAGHRHEPLQVARAAGSIALRARNDACVPLSHWVCDGIAELDAIAILLGCTRLGELDAAVAGALDDWQTQGGEAAPRIPRLAPAIDAVLGALHALCLRGAAGDEALAAVAPIVELIELMRGPLRQPAPLVPESAPLARAAAAVRAAVAGYRDELARLGAAIDRVGQPGDRIAVALGVAARVHQIAVIAAAIATWIDGGGAATAAQARWRGAAAAIEQVFAGTLAGVRRLVPLPP